MRRFPTATSGTLLTKVGCPGMGFAPPSCPSVVLIVEDEPMLRMLARELLEEAGFRVIEAGTADDALQILEGRADIAVLFTDVDMPGSMSGVVLAEKVAARWPHIRLVVTSGRYGLTNDQLPDDGQFLHKPYRGRQLISAIGHAGYSPHGG